MGITFNRAGVPIDILPVCLLNSFLDDFSLLVTDEFLGLNGVDESSIKIGKDKLIDAIRRLDLVYDFRTNLLFCSSFMNTLEYLAEFKEIKIKTDELGLTGEISKTIPEGKRLLDSARLYPYHELACVKFLSEQGFLQKIGPTTEKPYDKIMAALGFKVSFAYLLNAYALGTRTAEMVVHYAPTSRGQNNGQRILLDDDPRVVKTKLQMGCDEALRYFCRIASVSGYLLQLDYQEETAIDYLYGKKLKQETIQLVLENIIKPYRRTL